MPCSTYCTPASNAYGIGTSPSFCRQPDEGCYDIQRLCKICAELSCIEQMPDAGPDRVRSQLLLRSLNQFCHRERRVFSLYRSEEEFLGLRCDRLVAMPCKELNIG